MAPQVVGGNGHSWKDIFAGILTLGSRSQRGLNCSRAARG